MVAALQARIQHVRETQDRLMRMMNTKITTQLSTPTFPMDKLLMTLPTLKLPKETTCTKPQCRLDELTDPSPTSIWICHPDLISTQDHSISHASSGLMEWQNRQNTYKSLWDKPHGARCYWQVQPHLPTATICHSISYIHTPTSLPLGGLRCPHSRTHQPPGGQPMPPRFTRWVSYSRGTLLSNPHTRRWSDQGVTPEAREGLWRDTVAQAWEYTMPQDGRCDGKDWRTEERHVGLLGVVAWSGMWASHLKRGWCYGSDPKTLTYQWWLQCKR